MEVDVYICAHMYNYDPYAYYTKTTRNPNLCMQAFFFYESLINQTLTKY